MPDITICINKSCLMAGMCGRSDLNNPVWSNSQSVAEFKPETPMLSLIHI